MSLSFRTQGGFCNRLRAIVSACLWAEDLDRELNIYWPIEPGHMACSLEDIFIPSSIPRLLKVEAGYLSKAHQVLTKEDMEIVVQMSGMEIRIESYSEFHPESKGGRGLRLLRQIRFQPELEACADNIWRKIGGKSSWLGVHFRGTDHRKCLAASPLSGFRQIDEPFLFLSDEIVAKEEMVKKGGIIIDCLLGRKTAGQQRDAVIEWLVLQKCSRILASLGSSYSEMAARRSGATLELSVSP
jgi:hypothetical protein